MTLWLMDAQWAGDNRKLTLGAHNTAVVHRVIWGRGKLMEAMLVGVVGSVELYRLGIQ